MTTDYSSLVHRAALPELMLVPDLAVALQVSPAAARRAVLRGDCGPYLRVGRRIAVLRESFVATLASRQRFASGDSPFPDPDCSVHERGVLRGRG